MSFHISYNPSNGQYDVHTHNAATGEATLVGSQPTLVHAHMFARSREPKVVPEPSATRVLGERAFQPRKVE